jgi:superfamily II DNA or RNA helicase
MSDSYLDLIASKIGQARPRGLENVPSLHPGLFPHQRDVGEFLINRGSGAPFLDTGMGKTLVELEFARVMSEHTNKPAIIFTPLAVGPQMAREAARFGIEARPVKHQGEVGHGLNITNYERLHLFDRQAFGAIVLDESGILKSFSGKTTRALMDFAEPIAYRCAGTATPAPNDHMEIGQHSQFLGVMDSSEMLARWFIADQKNMGRYRLKGYAVKPFWSWVASWARCVSKPSDLGYSDEGFILPELKRIRHLVRADISQETGGLLMRLPDTSATAIHKEKRLTAAARAEAAVAPVLDEANEPWVIWVDTDYEAAEIMRRLPGAVEVHGRMKAEEKENILDAFSRGVERVLVTKPSIAGWGLNWQHCARTAFAGLSFSYESYYQAVRRFWRFGQQREVHCHIAMADTELSIWNTISRKAGDHESMKREMADAMRRATIERSIRQQYEAHKPATLPAWIRGAV